MSDASQAVFLSYASQDAKAARAICDALRAAGVEVWFDQSELRGGDAWDAKIRKQIAECALFVPVISANTQARREGYFRIEWRLAAQRTHAMSDDTAFLLPVVIDDTRDADAKVPAEFKAVQWTRLGGGDTPPAFGERVRRLLEGEVVARSGDRSQRSKVRGQPGEPRTGKAMGPRPSWIVPAIIGAIGCAAVASWLFQSRSDSAASNSKPQIPNSGLASAATPMTEARKLAEQARALLNGDDANRENLTLAEELLRKAVGLDPADGEALAVYAELSTSFVRFGFDRSDARRELARAQSERAVKLAPTSFEARFAQAYQYYLLSPGEGERLTRELLRERPGDRRLLFTLGLMLSGQRRADDAYHVFRRVAELPGGDAHALREIGYQYLAKREWEAADKALAESILIQPLLRSKWARVLLHLYGRGDLEGALNGVRELPAWAVLEDRGAYLTSLVHLWRRKPDEAIHALNRVPRDYFADNWFTGPKSYLLGQAQALAARMEAARTEWQNALALVEKKLAADPRSTDLLYWRARTLAALGRTVDAEKARALYDESERKPDLKRARLAKIDVLLGHAEAALDNLESHLALRTADSLEEPFSVQALRLDPTWDALHGNPRYEKLVTAVQLAASNAKLQTPKSKPADLADAKSVAVLAFANLSDDKDNEYFSEGISEELLNLLAKVPGLRVAARTSAFHFKGRNATAQEIGQKLGIAHIVDGSVRKSGNAVRVIAHLNRTDTGEQIWTEKFDGNLEKPWELQERIAGRIAQALQVKLGATSQATRSINPEAYRLMLEGRYYWNQRSARTEEVLTRAAQTYQRALEIDPTFAEAHAGLGDVWVTRGLYRSMDGRGALAATDYAQARREAGRALELDALLAEPHVTLAYVAYCERQFAESEGHYARAFALNPNYALAHHWHALLLAAEGHLDRAVEEITRSLQLDPLSSNALWSATIFNYYAGRLNEAIATSERALELRPGVLPILTDRAMVLLKLGRKQDAIAAARQVCRDLSGELRWWADADAIYVLRESGETAEAARHAEEMLARFPAGDYRRAFVLAASGRGEEALQSIETVPVLAVSRLYGNPLWDAWRQDPRFVQLMTRLGYAKEYEVARETLARMLKPANPIP